MGTYLDLVSKINNLLVNQERITVAITAPSGGGKSYLADRLRSHFSQKKEQIIRIDTLYSLNPDGPEILDQTDWELVEDRKN